MRVRAENLIDTSHGNFCPESYTNWRIVASVNHEMADGTREKVQIAVAPRYITALERRGYTVWHKPRKNLAADEKNWTDLKTGLLETQSQEKRRNVSIKEFLSWNYVSGPTSDVDVAAQETQPPRPTTAGKNIPMPTVRPGAVRAKPRPVPFTVSQAAEDNVPPPPPPPRPSTGGKGALRPSTGGKGALRPTTGGIGLPNRSASGASASSSSSEDSSEDDGPTAQEGRGYSDLVSANGAITAQRDGSPEQQDDSPEQVDTQAVAGALGGAAAGRQNSFRGYAMCIVRAWKQNRARRVYASLRKGSCATRTRDRRRRAP
jgi:hypothetical protein